ncbi:MAG: diacylglycerol kinase family protein [Patescibacteria group bacterium]|jgi:diacylglycerol kinase (ATP)
MADFKNILIIYNPISGHMFRHWNDRKIIQKFFDRKKISYTWLETKAESNKEIEAELLKEYDRVLVAGGDGTIRSVAHYIIKNHINTPLGIIPFGTMNFFALALGIPLPLKWALEFFYKNEPVAFDAGLVNNEKYFFVACGAHFDAKFIKATTRNMKKFFGALAYFIIATSKAYNKDRVSGKLKIDGQDRNITFSTFVVFNIRSAISRRKHFILKIHPGYFDVLIADMVTVPTALRLIHKLLRRNKPQYKDLELLQGKNIDLVLKREVLFQMDGEVWQGDHLDIRIIPNAIKIIGHR